MYFVMHRAGVKTSHLIHPSSEDIPNNFLSFDIVTIIPEICGDLMGQGTGYFHCKAPGTSAASALSSAFLLFALHNSYYSMQCVLYRLQKHVEILAENHLTKTVCFPSVGKPLLATTSFP